MTGRTDRVVLLFIAGILFTASLVLPVGAETITIGDSIRTAADVNVIGNPGLPESNPPVMWKGNKGTITGGPADVDGCRWWQISYDVGVSGWSPEGGEGNSYLEPVPPPPQPPDGFTIWAERSISWARLRAGRHDWNSLCMKFVVNAFTRQEGAAAGGNADDFARTLDRFDQQPDGWHSAPRGAVIFFEGRDSNAFGHAAIYLGDGRTIDAFGSVAEHSMDEFAGEPHVGRYLGWAYPPESWRPAISRVRLSLSVHDRSGSGPLLPGVRVAGSDGTGTPFDTTTDASGGVMIEGDAGEWHITSSRGGFQTTTWTLPVLLDGRQDLVLQPIPPPSLGELVGWGQDAYGQKELPDGVGYFVIALYTGILVVPWFSTGNPPGLERTRHVKQILDTSHKNSREDRPTVHTIRRAGPQDDPVPAVRKYRKVQYMSFILHLLSK